MPELPEVETIKRGLDEKVVKKEISKIWIDKSFEKKLSPSRIAFVRALQKEHVQKVWRRAKLLIFELSNDLFLLIHLKMTGQLVYKPAKGSLVFGGHPIAKVKELPSKFTRVIFYFKDNSILFFNDVRKFGFLKIVDDLGLAVEIEKYGLEPLDKEFTLEHFNYVLSLKPSIKIKQFLLEQKLLSGLGNIYADEALFGAKIKPTRIVKTLKIKEKCRLYDEIRKVLQKAIKLKGTSFSDYVNSEGGTGGFQHHLNVYGRGGQECKSCQNVIKKIKLGGRSSSYCPVCQK